MNHRSPFGSYDDRDEMLDAIWPSVGSVWAVELEIFGEGPGYMVRYSHNVDPASTHAEYIRFDGDRIAEIEVYLSKFPQKQPAGRFCSAPIFVRQPVEVRLRACRRSQGLSVAGGVSAAIARTSRLDITRH